MAPSTSSWQETAATREISSLAEIGFAWDVSSCSAVCAPSSTPFLKPAGSAPAARLRNASCSRDRARTIHLYQDVLGLTLNARLMVPNDALSDDVGSEAIWGDVDHVWEIATLDNGKGAPIELYHPIYPAVVVMDKSTDYGFTGHTEQGFAVEDINAWYKWIVDNGYRPQSKPWEAAPAA